MVNKVFIALLIVFVTVSFAVATYAYSETVVASIDNKNVTVESLTGYVEDVAGRNYESWLRDKEGLRKLADFYINRTLLLEHARKTVDKKNTIVNNHSVRSVDADVMLLSSLLKREVQDKVQVTQGEIRAYMKKNSVISENNARQALESEQKNRLMEALVKKVRTGHNIRYY